MVKRTFKFYLAIWAALLILFNVISFVSVGRPSQGKYTPSFWIGYIFITLTFVGQLICAYLALKGTERKKIFYNISLITTSYTGLVLSFVIGGLCMLVPTLPYWISTILCVIVLVFNVIAVVKATAAIDIVSQIDDKIKGQTFFVKSLTVDAEGLIARAQSEAVKAECKKVYEAVRYSDPMSHEALASIESEIAVRFSKLTDIVTSDDSDKVTSAVDEIVVLLGDRNKKCKLLK